MFAVALLNKTPVVKNTICKLNDNSKLLLNLLFDVAKELLAIIIMYFATISRAVSLGFDQYSINIGFIFLSLTASVYSVISYLRSLIKTDLEKNNYKNVKYNCKYQFYLPWYFMFIFNFSVIIVTFPYIGKQHNIYYLNYF